MQGFKTCNSFEIVYNSDMKYHNKKLGFTLAEVLITLGIIGVVAALTLVVLVGKYKDMVLKQQFKRAYSNMQQAYQQVYSDTGYNYDCFYWKVRPYPEAVCVEWNDAGTCTKLEMPDGSPKPADYAGKTNGCAAFMSHLEKYLKIVKKCNGHALRDKCIPKYMGIDTYYKQQDDTLTDDMAIQKAYGCSGWTQSQIENNRIAYVLADGTILLLYGSGPSIFAIDINGMKGPNKWGHDLFSFGTRATLEDPAYVATDLSCNPVEKGGRNTAYMLLYSYK